MNLFDFFYGLIIVIGLVFILVSVVIYILSLHVHEKYLLGATEVEKLTEVNEIKKIIGATEPIIISGVTGISSSLNVKKQEIVESKGLTEIKEVGKFNKYKYISMD